MRAAEVALVERLATHFRASGGDIRAVLETLFASREFHNSIGNKYKTPYQFVISAVRAAGVDVENPRPLLAAMARLGMPLYRCQTPDGYKNTQEAWLNPDASMLRIDFAMIFGGGKLPLATAPGGPRLVAAATVAPVAKSQPVDPPHLEQVLGSSLTRRTQQIIAEAPADLRAAAILGSPDFMQR
jgi:uncharacterized protein (DUF1800 family)